MSRLLKWETCSKLCGLKLVRARLDRIFVPLRRKPHEPSSVARLNLRAWRLRRDHGRAKSKKSQKNEIEDKGIFKPDFSNK